MIRRARFSGSFYPQNIEKLNELMNFYYDNIKLCNKYSEPIGIIVPHAGYIYSGKIAALAYKKIFNTSNFKRVFLIGPNHSGIGSNISIYDEGSWETPYGKIKVDTKIAKKIIETLNINNDISAHYYEHSLEVQLPFLQYVLKDNFSIVPITLKDQSFLTVKNIAKVLKPLLKKGDLIIASTDLNHYEKQEITYEKDLKIIKAIEQKDVEDLYIQIETNDITMCGYGAVGILLNLEFKDVNILGHTTSGDVTYDYSSVVGYMSAILKNSV
ncbi:MEMO1 family protein [Tepiditoga spiralis]|uniref:MEMO1 family protein OSSY52_05260 n=1 Tax=Tepiditoga spiralis TaxID=2108365 RepID=A0A7G1G341_9BACT|nr:AmmeMemoRadiSam system protein B [Tepiditoga spiralis]BBE30385.1 MEMO1 family protein [Tepiditoga spiralis]